MRGHEWSTNCPFHHGCLDSFVVSGSKEVVASGSRDVDVDLAERMSAMKLPGESDMDYYERRYQERVCILYSNWP